MSFALAVIACMKCSIGMLSKIDTHLASRIERRRWQAAIALGELAATVPGLIWPLVLKHGSRRHADVRMAVATCVLDHILEYHFDAYFPRVAKASTRSPWFRDTFRSCWRTGLADLPRNARRWRSLEKALGKIDGQQAGWRQRRDSANVGTRTPFARRA